MQGSSHRQKADIPGQKQIEKKTRKTKRVYHLNLAFLLVLCVFHEFRKLIFRWFLDGSEEPDAGAKWLTGDLFEANKLKLISNKI